MPPPDAEPAPHILILVYSLARGGAERMTVELARDWADRGSRVTVLTLAPVETDFFSLDPRVERLQLAFPADPNGGVMSRVAANLGRLRAIRRVLTGLKPDVALGMMSTSAVLLALASVGLPIRTFGSERTYPPMMPLGFSKERIRWFTYGLLTGVIGQTEDAAAWLRKHTRARRVHVIPNHISLPLPAQQPVITPASVLGDDRRCVLSVGRMTEEKQFTRLIDAFAAVAPQFPEWDLVILGEGPDRPDLTRQILDVGLGQRIRMPGSAGNVGDWYQRADIFTLTSRFEGFPNVLLEAMAHGAPPIAFDCMTGPSELIQNGENGILVPLNDMTGLVDGLSRLMNQEALRTELGRRAMSTRERFGGTRTLDLWRETFGLGAERYPA